MYKYSIHVEVYRKECVELMFKLSSCPSTKHFPVNSYMFHKEMPVLHNKFYELC